MAAGREIATLEGHAAEVVSLTFNTVGDLLVTGSFDHNCRLWDLRAGKCVGVLAGHLAEISSV